MCCARAATIGRFTVYGFTYATLCTQFRTYELGSHSLASTRLLDRWVDGGYWGTKRMFRCAGLVCLDFILERKGGVARLEVGCGGGQIFITKVEIIC